MAWSVGLIGKSQWGGNNRLRRPVSAALHSPPKIPRAAEGEVPVASPPNEYVKLIDLSGSESTQAYPCFEHPTLTDELDTKGVTGITTPLALALSGRDHRGWPRLSSPSATAPTGLTPPSSSLGTIGAAGTTTSHLSPNSYEYSFRVPLIVVSPYAKAGYISHATHDFASILKFAEETYGLPSLGYADALADDLSDGFDFSQTPITFQTINAPLDAAYFLNYTGPRTDPDDE